MKTLLTLLLMLATAFPTLAATTWPAGTNTPNQTFFGNNNFLGTLKQNGVNVLTNLNGVVTHRIGFVGDSITETASSGWTTNLMAQPLFGTWSSTNVAVSGYTTDHILSNLLTITNWLSRSAAAADNFCWVFGGYVDAGLGTNILVTESNLLACWSAITNVGGTPIVATIYPSDSNGATAFSAYNNWIRSNYMAYRAILVDLEKVMLQSNGLTYDGLHPNALGRYYIARAVEDAIAIRQGTIQVNSLGTNAMYLGSAQPKDWNTGANGKTNIVLKSDGTVFVPAAFECAGIGQFDSDLYIVNAIYANNLLGVHFIKPRLSGQELQFQSWDTTERMRLTEAGNFGIGTTSPSGTGSANLTVSNSVYVGGAITATNGIISIAAPTLQSTNAAPAGFVLGVTLPVVWFAITNAGNKYLIPGFAP